MDIITLDPDATLDAYGGSVVPEDDEPMEHEEMPDQCNDCLFAGDCTTYKPDGTCWEAGSTCGNGGINVQGQASNYRGGEAEGVLYEPVE